MIMDFDVCMLTPNRNDQVLINTFAAELSLDEACYSGMYFFRIRKSKVEKIIK